MHLRRRIYAATADVQNDVPGLQAAFSRVAIGIDFGDHHALNAGAEEGARRRKRQAKYWRFARLLLLTPGFRRGSWKLAERYRDGLSLSRAQDVEFRHGPGRQGGAPPGQLA